MLLRKYFKINGRLIDCLRKHSLWFANAKEFNDVYDCNLEFDFENSNEEIDAYIRWQHNEYNRIGWPNDIRNIELRKIRVKEYLERALDNVGICCFSSDINPKDELLMWAHYGDSYKGACLVFDTDKDKK